MKLSFDLSEPNCGVIRPKGGNFKLTVATGGGKGGGFSGADKELAVGGEFCADSFIVTIRNTKKQNGEQSRSEVRR